MPKRRKSPQERLRDFLRATRQTQTPAQTPATPLPTPANAVPIDVTQTLRDTENALRDFIGTTLLEALGPKWTDECGVTPDRLARWQERKEIEGKRQESGAVEERLIYYADFYDLKTILKKHWQRVAPALGELRTFEVFLTELEHLRDPDAHRRELLPHQRHLALGICGEIRGRIIRFRSKKETAQDCFPRLESVRDSLGNIWTSESEMASVRILNTDAILRPGDYVDLVVTASDPEGAALEYSISHSGERDFRPLGEARLIFADEHIGQHVVRVEIRSNRTYHAHRDHDDGISIIYTVLPKR